MEKTIKYNIPVDESHPYHGVEAAPTQRESRRDDREFNEERGRRNFGHSKNNQGRDRNSEGGRSDRSNNQNRDNRKRDDRKRGNDEKKGGFLSFIGLGKKNEDKNNRRPNRDNRSGSGRSDRFERSDRPQRSERNDRFERSDRPQRSERNDRFDRNDRRPRSGSDNRNDRRDNRQPIRDGNSIYEKETHNKTSSGFGWFGKKDKKSKPDLSVDSALGELSIVTGKQIGRAHV